MFWWLTLNIHSKPFDYQRVYFTIIHYNHPIVSLYCNPYKCHEIPICCMDNISWYNRSTYPYNSYLYHYLLLIQVNPILMGISRYNPMKSIEIPSCSLLNPPCGSRHHPLGIPNIGGKPHVFYDNVRIWRLFLVHKCRYWWYIYHRILYIYIHIYIHIFI